MDKMMEKFASMIAEKIASAEINPELMEKMVDSFNEKQKPNEEMKVESLIKEIISEILAEAKPTQKDPDVTYTPIGKNGKPGKPTTIKYSSAIKYDKKHPAYIAAMKLKDTDKTKKTNATAGAGLFTNDPEYQKRMGAVPKICFP